MIPETAEIRQTPAWQAELAGAVTDPAELLALLGLGPEFLGPARLAAAAFPLKVPRGFVSRMRRGDPADPLLRQVLPLGAELDAVPGFSSDPVGDQAARCSPGVLQKYAGRVLLTATGACAVHCRYCFRRHYPYAEENASTGGFESALAYVAADESVHEVILSGGDPLTLSDRRLCEFSARLRDIAHVRCLRIHTRLPIVLPSRVTPALREWLAGASRPVVIVVHANHPQEIDAPVGAALAALKATGVTLLNQTVLLRGVNDDADTLVRLSGSLFGVGVLPYYLHALDRTTGTAHFDVPEVEARALHERLRARLPGYLVPRLVREVPGAPAKVPLL